jgi:dolichol-phosphate mannosyltransferase
MGRSEAFKLSVIIPVLNEAECLMQLVAELEHVVPPLTPDYEVLFIDDRSTDDTFEILRGLAQRNPRIKCVSLSRNMGHQAALACGLDTAIGDVVVTMDGDLQHPPSLIPRLVELWRQGFDVVNTVREGGDDGRMSRWFYWLFNRVGEVKITPASPDFRLLDRRAVDALNGMREHLRFYRAMVSYIGFRQITIPFQCPPRYAGRRSYSVRQSLRMASNGILSFSTAALKIPFLLGMVILVVVLGYFGVAALLALTGTRPLEKGWTSIVALVFLSLGLQLTSIGVFGLYLGKMFVELKGRPIYFVGRTIGFEESAGSEPAAPPLKLPVGRS